MLQLLVALAVVPYSDFENMELDNKLQELIEKADRVFIMGHLNPDADCFGAAIGVYRLCNYMKKEARIIIGAYDEGMTSVVTRAIASGLYEFASAEKAVPLASKDSLAIVVDTHNLERVECPELVDICDDLAIIDHHLKMVEGVICTKLMYVDSEISSTSEIVTEVLKRTLPEGTIKKIDAEALLAGITIDTNNFSIKTAQETFEAAAWLCQQGADPTEVKKILRQDSEALFMRSAAVAGAEIDMSGIAIAKIEARRNDAQLMCAQVADTLLTVRGVVAAFAFGRNRDDKTVISARSLGEVNVKDLMEGLGGGGHFTTAAAQVDMDIDEAIEKVKKLIEEV